MSKQTNKQKHFLGCYYVTIWDILYVMAVAFIIVGIMRVFTPYADKKVVTLPIKAQAAELSKKITLISPLASSPTPEITDTPIPSEPWDQFVIAAQKISKIYNYPPQVVIAQAALESHRGDSFYARTRNNYLGIGAYDVDPDNAYAFENVEQCVIEYMQLVRKNFPEAWSNRDNAEKLLKLLEDNSKGNYYASDPDYVSKVMQQAEWEMY
jgi:hypothetical protein